MGWQVPGFMHQTIYAVPKSPGAVKTTVAPAFEETSTNMLAVILDIEVTLKESLTFEGRSLKKILEEMRDLKNKAFFSLLTPEALQQYI